MEIIKKGKIPSEMKAEFSCSNCNSVLSAKKNEGKSQMDRDGSYVSFKCPVCSHPIYVDAKLFN